MTNYNENVDLQTQKNKSSVVKKIICWIIVIIFSPLILLYFLFKKSAEKSKFKKWQKEGKRGKLLLMTSDISQIDLMQGYEFENYLSTLFFYDGYQTTLTSKSKDFGADFIAVNDQTKTRSVVQAKRYNKIVGTSAVQEIIGAIKHYNADDAIVVTNSHFSSSAETLARENNVRLIDREELIEIYTRVKKQLQIYTSESELAGNVDTSLEERFPYLI